ncbi:MAG: cobalamin-dependent protein [Actinobacteria bacterium]|nr:cobalamin-dependent protein [Actinomycetota bacterium]MBU4218407.1 cobalamin-dependent protein [Actinomycetota bacterium]MBU4358749.1 cobalamin-dependent protein [Actinomycetota bacterium]MCG2819974.1 cobalamin-dependent protein [Actinomycetes bacterium]
MSRVLLINPPKKMPLLDWTMRYPPLGLMSIAAVLDGHEVEILDMKAEKTRRKELPRRLGSVDIVGITVLTPSFDSALEICRIAGECGALTVLGGVHPTLMPQVVAYPEVDIVVRGEGELTFREIADGRPLGSIPGISYVSGSTVVHNPDRPHVDLNTLPPPRRDLVAGNKKKYKAFNQTLGALSTARGCPYRCSFCCVPKVWKGYRELSPIEVVSEIKRMDRTEIVSIVDDNFCQDMGRVEAICDLIIRERLDDRLYSVFSRVDSIVQHPEVVAKMAQANMRVVFIGIEAATQASLDRMNKKTRIEEIYRACQILEENGILIWAGNIVGNLDDTYGDVEALIGMNMELPIDISDFTVITPWPGTDLYQFAIENNLIDELDFTEYCECEPHMHTPNLSRIEIMELEIKAYMKFYGFRAMVMRARRWSGNPRKRWLVERDYKGFRSFWKFRNKSAFYFWRTYKEMVGKTEATKIRKYSPLVSTPVLYSIGAGILAAFITLLLTAAASRYYGQYPYHRLEFIVVDLLFASLLVASITAIVATWFAIRSYRRGWIFSVRPRRPARRKWSLSKESLRNGVLFSAAAFVVTSILVFIYVIGGFSSQLTYGMKEALVTVIAFLASCIASYVSIHAVRNGGITRTAS